MEIALPPPGDFAGYIFDCDGTLAASMHLHYRAWKQALADHGAKIDFTWELFLSHAGRGTEYFVSLMNRHHGEKLDPVTVAETQDRLLLQFHHTVEPVLEVVNFARKLALHRKPLAVASGGTRAAVTRTLEYIGVTDLFPVVVTIDDVVHGKPAPDSFLEAARRLAVPAQECLVLGDSILDIEGAKAAGMAWVKLEPR
jgi:HAD superfamily hydrolase (TIGR01509 family)